MVHYSIDTEPRRLVVAVLALLALGFTYLPSYFFPEFNGRFGPLSVLGVFGGLFYFFDRILWRMIPVHGVPDLSGTWKGELIRGTTPGSTTGKTSTISFVITQTWSRMDIVFKGTHSFSRAEIIGLFISNPNHIELCYGYHKRPNDATSSGHEYSNGYTRLMLVTSPPAKQLIGRYFSDEYRGGTIQVSM